MQNKKVKISLEEFIAGLDEAQRFHGHICPGMYNGVKMALGAKQILEIDYPDRDLIVVTEIDRCLTDALMIITGCRFGRKTLKLKDLGKFAATFKIGKQCLRIAQKDGIVKKVMSKLESTGIDYHDYKAAAESFLEIPFYEHFSVTENSISFDENELPGKPKIKINCSKCGETVMDAKHVVIGDEPFCKSCIMPN
ncbi:MAG: FmdE family protein [Candidatus Rifleibacteriota bacterium]